MITLAVHGILLAIIAFLLVGAVFMAGASWGAAQMIDNQFTSPPPGTSDATASPRSPTACCVEVAAGNGGERA